MLGAPCHRVMLVTDASLMGWEAIVSGRSARGLWRDHHLSWYINCLEMLAVFQALKHFLLDLRGHHVLVQTDNTSVVSYINRQGLTVVEPCISALYIPRARLRANFHVIV